jgi:hypothetical protein
VAEQTRLSFTTSVIMINSCDRRWSLNVTTIVLLQRRETAVEYDLLCGGSSFRCRFQEMLMMMILTKTLYDPNTFENVNKT